MESARTYWISETAGVLDLPGAATLERQRRIWWLAGQFRARPGVREVVSGMNNLTVEFDHAASGSAELLQALEDGWNRSRTVAADKADASEVSNASARRIEIPVRYGGPGGDDLDEVARHTGLPRGEVIRLHTAARYTVCFLGFLPGFAYLIGMDPRLATPRRRVPRVSVAAGSVGIGGEQTAIYPLASPAGWQIIGSTPLKLFDPDRDPPSLLMPGDVVRFVQAEGPG